MDALTSQLFDGVSDEDVEGVKSFCLDNWNEKAKFASSRQKEIAIQNSKSAPCAVNGIGELIFSIDAQIYHFWDWKMPGCWKDEDFRDWFGRTFPETVVKCKGSKSTTILMPGFKKCR